MFLLLRGEGEESVTTCTVRRKKTGVDCLPTGRKTHFVEKVEASHVCTY